MSEGGNTSVQIFPGSAVEDIGWVTEQGTQVEAPQGWRVKIVSAWVSSTTEMLRKKIRVMHAGVVLK